MDIINPLTEAIIKNNKKPEKNRNIFTKSDYEKIYEILAQQNLASEFCKKLYKEINEFGLSLDSESEVAVRLVSFGETVQFGIESIGFQTQVLLFLMDILLMARMCN